MKAHPEQLIQLIMHTARRLWAEPSRALDVPALFAHGGPGTGKSAAFREAARRLGIEFRDVRLSQYEPTDLRGLPVPDQGKTTWLPSAELPWTPGTRGLLLLDELTSADRTVQAAAYQLVLDRCVGPLTLPEGWLVCAAGNRASDRAIAHPLSSALANRFCHIEIEPDLPSWTAWARAQGLAPEVVAFLRFRPERFFNMEGDLERGWPSPRSWERVAWALTQRGTLDDATLALQIEGLVGEGAAVEFAAFRRQWGRLPEIADLLHGRVPCRMPATADQRHALCTALAFHLWRTPGDQATLIDNFLRIGLQFSSEFATLAMIDATRDVPNDADGSRLAALFSHPRYAAWIERHGAALSASAPTIPAPEAEQACA
jgi:hypothetical protein